ncbi:MAG: metallophosphoesterase family protein [Treponema sp.]|jgi:putative phosphoesterase|nr:metallophosphoesterase family protein [Treponema sp.]
MQGFSVLVISDSHGNLPALTAALRWAVSRTGENTGGPPGLQPLTAAFFLGDGMEDLAAASAETGFSLPWYCVRGNGDLDFSVPDALVPTMAGKTFFLSHGNRYHVETGCGELAAAARSAGAEAALFGHTHVPFCARYGNLLLLNPGSIGRPRSRSGPSFALLDCSGSGDRRILVRFFSPADRGGAVRELRI